MMFSSSRTLPGQWWSTSRSMALAVHGWRGLFQSLGGALQEVLDQFGDIFASLAQRRDVDRDDGQAEVEVLAEAAVLHFAAQSRGWWWPARARRRRRVTLEPTRSNVCSCSTRSSLACSGSSISVISSSRTVP